MKYLALISLALFMLVVGCRIDCSNYPVRYEPVVVPIRVEKECADLKEENEQLKDEIAKLYGRMHDEQWNRFERECHLWDCD